MLERVNSLTSRPHPRQHVEENHLRQSINVRLDELLPPANARCDGLTTAMRHALLGPGKRLRPVLALLAGHEWGAPPAAMLDAACALEMVHCASLIFDDLPAMDNATVRRGWPTAHVVHGVDVAMLAGIAMLARSFAVLSSLQGTPSGQRSALVALLAEAVGHAGLARGQLDDLRGGVDGVGIEELSRTRALKTGVLFHTAVLMAATLAGVDDARRQPLLAFASHLGHAFQIADDLHDAAEDAAGPATCVSLLGATAARRLLQTHLDGALAELSSPSIPLALWARSLFDPLRATSMAVG